MLTSIKLMQAMLDQKLPLSKLTEPLKLYPKVLKNVRVTDKDAAISNPAVQAAFEQAQRELEGNGRALLREGDEPHAPFHSFVHLHGHPTRHRFLAGDEVYPLARLRHGMPLTLAVQFPLERMRHQAEAPPGGC